MTTRQRIEKELRRLQKLARQSRAGDTQPVAKWWTVDGRPTSATTPTQVVSLGYAEVDAMERTRLALLGDRAYEHLGKDAEGALEEFVTDCLLNEGDRVADFVAAHAQEPVTTVCYLPVLHLDIESAADVFGVCLLPLEDAEVPSADMGFRLGPPVGAVAAVEVFGTNPAFAAQRAQATARTALRMLRVALREHRALSDLQLRFTLGHSYAFSGGAVGWRVAPDVRLPMPYGPTFDELVAASPLQALPPVPGNDVERKAHLALEWMERASLVGEPLITLLYLFFALEALLGDKSEGLKAHGLALRQAMLSSIVTGHFSHPDTTYFLYDRVRSGAVHGEDTPDVDGKMVVNFAWNVRLTLIQYVEFARDRGFTKRGQLLRALDTDEKRPGLIAWLRDSGTTEWGAYCDDLEGDT